MSTDAIRRVLTDAPGDALCGACLSAICGVSTADVYTMMTSLLGNADEFQRGWSCASCRRQVSSIFYRAKCAHCSERLQPGEQGHRMGDEMFHIACLRRLITDDSIRLSRALGGRSRRLIAQSRRRMRKGDAWPPLESP